MPTATARGVLMSQRTACPAAAVILTIAAGCGGTASSGGGQAADPNGPEVNPAGDIPDNQAFVRYAPPGCGFSVKVPEGWSRTAAGGAITFTDKLNAVRIETTSAKAPPSVREVGQVDIPRLAASVKGFKPGTVSAVKRKGGTAVRITYLATATPNAVTGKTGQDAVERYVFFRKGRDAIITLSGPKGADNVDPWRIVSDSLTWSR